MGNRRDPRRDPAVPAVDDHPELLVAAMVIAFAFCAVVMKSLFTLSPLDFAGMLLLVVFAALAYPALQLAYRVQERLTAKYALRKKKEKT